MEKKLSKNVNNHLHIDIYLYWILLMVWQLFRPTSNRSSLDLIIKLLLIIFLIISTVKLRFTYPKKNFLLCIVFSFYMLISLLSKEDTINFTVIVTYLFPALFAFLFLVHTYNYRITERSYLMLLNLIITTDLTMVIYSIIFQFEKIKRAFTIGSSYSNELTSFFISNHEYALYLLIGFQSCLLCYHFLSGAKSLVKNRYIILSLLFLVNMILTFSRTAILGVCVLLITYILISNNNKVKRLALSLMLTTVILFIISKDFNEFMLKIVLKGNNDAGRFSMWNFGLNIYKDSSLLQKLTGQGSAKITQALFYYSNHKSFHNAYIQVLLQFGLIGFLFFIYVIISSIINGIKLTHKDKFLSAMFISTSISTIAYMFTNTTLIMQSSIDSYILTMFSIILPIYVKNSIYNNEFYDIN